MEINDMHINEWKVMSESQIRLKSNLKQCCVIYFLHNNNNKKKSMCLQTFTLRHNLNLDSDISALYLFSCWIHFLSCLLSDFTVSKDVSHLSEICCGLGVFDCVGGQLRSSVKNDPNPQKERKDKKTQKPKSFFFFFSRRNVSQLEFIIQQFLKVIANSWPRPAAHSH